MELPAHKTKIVCTIGPASRSEAILERLMLHGMNVARLNFAHGTLQGHKEDIERIRAVAARLQRNCMVMADLPGPKIRIGRLAAEPLLLRNGDKVILTTEATPNTPKHIPVQYRKLTESVNRGSLVFLNDGFIQLQVDEVLGEEVFCSVVVGGPLLSHKGLSLPGVRMLADVVSDADLELVDFALQKGVDVFGVSFAETANDIAKVKRFAEERGRSAYVVAKIERAEAITNFDELLDAADAIMIARGDLGVQIPLQDVPGVQKVLIHKANRVGRPVITATQMLVSMTENIRPTRAEVSDVANAIMDGTDAVMLSEETAMGSYPVEALEMMAKIAISAERDREAVCALSDLPAYIRKQEGYGRDDLADLVSLQAVEAAQALKARYIIIDVQDRRAPGLIARFKPNCWVLPLGDEEKANRLLALSYGVHPLSTQASMSGSFDALMHFMGEAGLVESKEYVVLLQSESTRGINDADSFKTILIHQGGSRGRLH